MKRSSKILIISGIGLVVGASVAIGAGLGIYYTQYHQSAGVFNNLPLPPPEPANSIWHYNSERGFILDNYKLVKNRAITKLPKIINGDERFDYQEDFYYGTKLVSDHSLVGVGLRPTSDAPLVKLAHWNVLHFGLYQYWFPETLAEIRTMPEVDYSIGHALGILETINLLKPDILGLTEISYHVTPTSVDSFLLHLNGMDQTNNYQMLLSPPSRDYTQVGALGQSERIGILYDANKFVPTDQGRFYSNPLVQAHVWAGFNLSDYIRPPFGAQFQSVTDPTNKYSVIYAHFDSPGPRNKQSWKMNQYLVEQAIDDKNGAQEWFEAQQLHKVIEEFSAVYNGDNIFFMGDTNIKTGNEAKAFSTLDNVQFAFGDDLRYGTSYRWFPWVKYEDYFSNPYDKIIYRTNQQLVRAFD